VTFADAVAAHVDPIAAGCRPALQSTSAARGPAQRARRSAARSLARQRIDSFDRTPYNRVFQQ
jgi:hypothetical protein